MPRIDVDPLALSFELGLEKSPKPPQPEPNTAVERILTIYEHATPDQVSAGASWYSDAHEIAREMHREYPARLMTIAHAAGLIAAMSPNESWTKNLENAWKFLETDDSKSLPRSKDDARLIVLGFHPGVVLFRGGVNFKVQSFYENIAIPEESGPVTIDRHAKGIIYNDAGIVNVKPHATRQEYDFYELMYKKAAAEIGVLPHQMQAITWLVWRREHPQEQAEQLELDF